MRRNTCEPEQLEVAWHGAKWRDDRVGVPLPAVLTSPQGLSPEKRPHERRGGRKPVIANAVADVLRAAERPLNAVQVYERVCERLARVPCTVAGVHSAMHRLLSAQKIERVERKPGFGQFSATYRWKPNPHEALDAVKLTARKAEIGRLGGLKSGEARRRERDSAW